MISRLLPWNSNFAIAQAAATPKSRFSGTAIAATRSVSRIAASASGSVMPREIGAEPLAQRLDEHGEQRQQQEGAEEGERGGDQERADRGAVHGHHAHRVQAGRSEHRKVSGQALRERAQRCNRLIASSSRNETASITVPTTVAPA